MTLFGKSHYDLMDQFEAQFPHHRLDRETKDIWSKGRIYQNGQTNDLFLAFRSGFAYGTTQAEG